MVKKLIINADDLGFSLGVNYAILKANTEGYLSHASLMANTEYFEHAITEILPHCKDLKIGVHLNLTCAEALFSENVLQRNGLLNTTFINLLFKRKSKNVLESIEKEIECQILKIKGKGIKITHIDGHEHVHIIPSIHKIVKKLAIKYDIERVREINENFFESWKFNGRTTSISNISKLFILKFLSLFNVNTNKIGFYSMLNTCEINAHNLFDFLENSQTYESVEVMLHPGLFDLDRKEYYESLDQRFSIFLQNPYRKSEFDLCFHKGFEKYKTVN